MCPIVGGNSAVGDGSFAAVSGISAARVGPGAFVGRAPAVARRAIRCGSVKLGGRVVTRFGLSIALLGGEVARPRGQARIFTILRGLGAILGCKPAVVDRLGAIIRRLSSPQSGLSTFVCCAPAIGRGAIACGAVEITGRVVTRFGLPVTQPGRDVAVLGGHPRLPATRAGQLVGPGIVAVLGRLGPILGGHPAVVDGLGAVVRGPGAPRGSLVAFVRRMLTVGGGAIARGPVEIARRIVARFGFAVAQPCRNVTALRGEACLPTADTRQLVGVGIVAVSFGLAIALLGLAIAYIRSQVAVATFNVPLARRCEGVFVLLRPAALLD